MGRRTATLLLAGTAASLAASQACVGSAPCDGSGAEGEDHLLLLQTDISMINTRAARGEALEVAVADNEEISTANASEVVEARAADETDTAPAETAPADVEDSEDAPPKVVEARAADETDTAPAETAPADVEDSEDAPPKAAAPRQRQQQRRKKQKQSPASLLSKHWQAPPADGTSAGGHHWSTPFHGLTVTAAYVRNHVGAHSWFAGTFAAAAVALLCSGDDLIWLTPFAVHERRFFLLPFYCVCMISMAALAWLVQFSGHFLDSRNDNVPVEPIVRLVTAVALFWYSSYLYQEWSKDEWSSTSSSKDVDSGRPSLRGNLLPTPEAGWNTYGSNDALPRSSRRSTSPERRAAESPEPAEHATPSADLNESIRSLPTNTSVDRLQSASWLSQRAAGESVLVSLGPVGGIPKESPYWNLFVMCMVGSLYPSIAFVTLLYSNALEGSQLVAGVALNSVLVAGLCFGVTFSRTISALCERVPFWCIVFALGLWTVYALCQDTFAS